MNIFSKKFLSAGKAKAKALIYTDMALSLLLPLTLISGLLLHAAGHGFPVWKGWFGLHGLFGSLFLLFSAIHVKLHWGWFRSMKQGLKRKSRITVFSVVAVSCGVRFRYCLGCTFGRLPFRLVPLPDRFDFWSTGYLAYGSQIPGADEHAPK